MWQKLQKLSLYDELFIREKMAFLRALGLEIIGFRAPRGNGEIEKYLFGGFYLNLILFLQLKWENPNFVTNLTPKT